jgi:hypothetical protein
MSEDMQIGIRERMLGDLMADLRQIVEHCRVENESFDDFLIGAKNELNGYVDDDRIDDACKYVWSACDEAFMMNLDNKATLKKVANVFALFKDNSKIVMGARKLRGVIGVGDIKLQAILYNLHCYGLVDVTKEGWRFPFNLKITSLGKRVLKDPMFEELITDSLMLPFPTIEGRRAFWEQRMVTPK